MAGSLVFTAVTPAPTFACRQRGFTLTEMAVVLVIIALLIGGMVLPLSAQRDLRDAGEARKQLADSIEALYGYAASRAGKLHLPCPDIGPSTDPNPDITNDIDDIDIRQLDGLEDRKPDGSCHRMIGYFPWAELGIGRYDVWGHKPLRYAVAEEFSNSKLGFALLTRGTLIICPDTASVCTLPTARDIPAVVFVSGKNNLSEQPAGKRLTPRPTDFIDMPPSAAFDDLVAWLPSTILNSRMIVAGRLP